MFESWPRPLHKTWQFEADTGVLLSKAVELCDAVVCSWLWSVEALADWPIALALPQWAWRGGDRQAQWASGWPCSSLLISLQCLLSKKKKKKMQRKGGKNKVQVREREREREKKCRCSQAINSRLAWHFNSKLKKNFYYKDGNYR